MGREGKGKRERKKRYFVVSFQKEKKERGGGGNLKTFFLSFSFLFFLT